MRWQDWPSSQGGLLSALVYHRCREFHTREFLAIATETRKQLSFVGRVDRLWLAKAGIVQPTVVAAEQVSSEFARAFHRGARHSVGQANRKPSVPVTEVKCWMEDLCDARGGWQYIAGAVRRSSDGSSCSAEGASELCDRRFNLVHGLA
jgi:hypothetical protein